MTEKQSEKSKVHTIYKLKSGRRLPGITTITGILAKPALIHWAWNLGTKGIDYRKFRDDKAEIGTLVHYLIMQYLKGEEPRTDDYTKNQIDQAENSMLSFLEWEKSHPLSPILVETPLVSEKYGFGGTLDILAKMNGDNSLVEVKTGANVYPEYIYQLAAQSILLRENGYGVDNARILNIGRTEDEAFQDRRVGNLSKEKELFLHCLAIYNLKREIKGGKG